MKVGNSNPRRCEWCNAELGSETWTSAPLIDNKVYQFCSSACLAPFAYAYRKRGDK